MALVVGKINSALFSVVALIGRIRCNEKSKHSNRGGRRGTQRAENALAFLRVIYGSIKMKTNKEKSWN